MVHKRGRYQLLLGLLAVVALSPAEARVMADHEPVPQVIPVQNYWGWQPGTGGGTGKGASNYARSCKASAMNCEQRWINPDRGAANGCVQRVWELRDQYQRLCGGR